MRFALVLLFVVVGCVAPTTGERVSALDLVAAWPRHTIWYENKTVP
jgi:hypothetical protein